MFSWLPSEHPRLTDSTCILSSPKSNLYNCIAWAAGDVDHWWWPVPLRGINYWPKGIPREETVSAFIRAFETVGYMPCGDDSRQVGVEKIVLFAVREAGFVIPTHAARQLDTGQWTSKMGTLEDITHLTCDCVGGQAYGDPIQFLARQNG